MVQLGCCSRYAVRTRAGFGPGARFFTDRNPKYAFSSVDFVKGALYGSVWANGKVPSERVLALARVLYGRL
jgi:hypothetical protein